MEGRIWNEHGTYHLHCFISNRKSLKLASIHSTSSRRLRSGGGQLHAPSLHHIITFPPHGPSHLPSQPPFLYHTHLPLSITQMEVNSLKVLIHARQQSRGAQMDIFFDSLQQKYAKKQKSSSKAGRRIIRHQAAREQDIMHDITLTLWCCLVILVFSHCTCIHLR